MVRYLDEPLTADELDRLCRQLGVEPLEIIRTGDKHFKELGLAANDVRSRREWLEILAENPRFMQRPIGIQGDRAVVARPVTSLLDLL